MLKKKGIVFLYLCITVTAFSQSELVANVYNRNHVTSLNGEWHYIVDPYENGYYNYRYEPFDQQDRPPKAAFFMNAKPADKAELVEYDFDKTATLSVPGDWNTQTEKLYYYEGTVWYKRSFDYAKAINSDRVFLYFDAVNYEAEVYLNGKKLGTHTGGFTPFNFEVTALLKDSGNFLVVKVDNKRKKEGVPTLNTDWWNYGGITRDVRLVETPGDLIWDYFIYLNPENTKAVNGYVQLDGNHSAGKKININIPGLQVAQTMMADENGKAVFSFTPGHIRYWSDADPYLYKVTISAGMDTVNDKIGLRSIATSGTKILLNGKPIFLKGISIHEESLLHDGRAYSREDAKALLSAAKEMGCNYVRLAHYPHNENMLRVADEMGILVWAENPVYWTIQWKNAATFQNASNQLKELISRDKNRAAVIIWSMANETPVSEPRLNFLGRLAKQARTMDPTRLISAALERADVNNDPYTQTIHDPFADVVDVLSFNQYIGWYGGTPDLCEKINWKFTQQKPVLVSEFGGGAKYGLHGDSLTRWTEEYQAYIYRETLKMLDRIPQVQGFSPWILKDFRSPRRVLTGIQDDYNRKGLLSEKGEKKQAFFVLKNYYENKILNKK